MRLRTTITLALLLPLASCATIMTSAPKHVQVTSVPTGATFTSNVAGVQGVTPALVLMPRGEHTVSIDFQLEGHASTSVLSTPRLSPWVAGNIVFGGPLGLLIDAVNPNARVHTGVSVNLLPLDENGEPVQPPPAEPKAEPGKALPWSERPYHPTTNPRGRKMAS